MKRPHGPRGAATLFALIPAKAGTPDQDSELTTKFTKNTKPALNLVFLVNLVVEHNGLRIGVSPSVSFAASSPASGGA